MRAIVILPRNVVIEIVRLDGTSVPMGVQLKKSNVNLITVNLNKLKVMAGGTGKSGPIGASVQRHAAQELSNEHVNVIEVLDELVRLSVGQRQ